MECEANGCKYSADQEPFLFKDLAQKKHGDDTHAEVSPAHRRKMLAILHGDNLQSLRVQQFARQESGEGLLKATYNTEKEGPVITSAYADFKVAEACLKRDHLPATYAYARKVANTPAGYDVNLYMQLREHAAAVIVPVIPYFDRVFHDELKDQIKIFKACALIDPVRAEQQQPAIADLNAFGLLPMLQQRPALLQGIKAQLPAYLAEVSGIAKVNNIYEWWDTIYEAEKIPAWVEVSRYVLILRPHAAGPERIFARVRQTFGETQTGALEEIEAAMMSQVNEYSYTHEY